MTETLLALVPTYGLYIVALATALSCLALPIPSSLIMLTAGAFVASEDLNGTATFATALAGAILGDQAGFSFGRRGGAWLDRASPSRASPSRATQKKGKTARLIARAQDLAARWGGMGVFLSRWLFSPIGPYMNFVMGAAHMNRVSFTLWGALGELVWVSIYVGLGYAFGDQIETVASIAGNFSGVLAAGAVTVGLGLWLRSVLRSEAAKRS